MTKEEMKTLIAEKISGQGNQVDAGGALPTVLGEIIDAIPTELGLQFGGVLYDGDTIPETPNMFYVAGAGEYEGNFGEEDAVVIEDGNIAFFVVDAQGEASVQTIEITTGGGGAAEVEVIHIETGGLVEDIAAAANYVQNHEVPDLVIIDVAEEGKFLVVKQEYMFSVVGLVSDYGD